MFGAIGAEMQESTFIKKINENLKSIEADKDQSIWYNKYKENSEIEMDLMASILEFKKTINRVLDDFKVMDTDPCYETKVNMIKTQVDAISESMIAINNLFEHRFDVVEIEIWIELNKMKAKLLPHQLKIIAYEYHKQSIDDSDVRQIKFQFNEIESKFDYFEWDMIMVRAAMNTDTPQEINGFVETAFNRINGNGEQQIAELFRIMFLDGIAYPIL